MSTEPDRLRRVCDALVDAFEAHTGWATEWRMVARLA
jgi:hypothetical protein